MFRKLVILICLISFGPAAAGAQDVALLAGSQAAVQRAAEREQPAEAQLKTAAAGQTATVLAANDAQPCTPCPQAEAEHVKKTHPGLTFKEFCEVHFGEYRWVYWVAAATGLVLLHAFAFGD